MDYLERLDAAPPAERYPVIRGWIASEPRELFAQLRRERPILVTEDAVLVARNVDVMEVLRLPEVFTVDLNKPKMGHYMLAFDETPMNQRDKAVMRAMLNRDDLPRVREMVARFTDEALDDCDGRFDLIDRCTRHVPIRVVQEYFGFSGVPEEKMRRWSRAAQIDTFFNQPYDALEDAGAVHGENLAANEEMRGFLGQVLRRRGAELAEDPSADDILARLLKTRFPAEIDFGMERVGINVGGLLIGAVETTSKCAAHAVAELLDRPAVLERARAAAASDDPAAFDGYVWEALRFRPFIPFLYRTAARDYVLGRGTDRATTIPAGATVLALAQSAFFDPELVDSPEEFRADRPPEVHVLHLGYGHHRCLGDQVAKVMLPEIVRRVVLRPGLRAEGEIDYAGGPLPERYTVHFDHFDA